MEASISHLIQVEVGGVQSYIFDGSRLRGWRGASALLDQAERVDIPEALAPWEEAVTVLRRGGGVVLLGIREELLDADGEERPLEKIEDTVADAYRSSAPGAQVYSSRVPFDGDEMQEVLSALSFRTTENRNQAPQANPEASLFGALARPCGSCGARPAETDSEFSDDGTLLCSVCEAKATYGRKVRSEQMDESLLARFTEYLSGRPDSERQVTPEEVPGCVPEDLNAIAEVGNGSIALIQADGNSLGKTVQQIGSRAQYEALSRGIADAVETAVFSTLAKHGPRGTRHKTLPWEVIFLGGDDVLIATADDIGLKVARALTRRVEDETRVLFDEAPLGALDRPYLSMGTGVVFANPHVPMATLRSLAHSLERSAKDRTYALMEGDSEREVSALDFHRVMGSGSASLPYIRDYALRPDRTLGRSDVALTQRPFTIDELEQVIGVAEDWSREQLPGHKLQALRESLFDSPAAAMQQWTHVVARASDSERGTWQELNALTNPADGLAGDAKRERTPFVEHGGDTDGGPPPRLSTPLLDVIDACDLLD